MSGSSYSAPGGSFLHTQLMKFLHGLDEGTPLRVMVPSLNRCPGQFVELDHIFYDPRDKIISLDGDISEMCHWTPDKVDNLPWEIRKYIKSLQERIKELEENEAKA